MNAQEELQAEQNARYDKALAQLRSDVESAIERSISHTESVDVAVPGDVLGLEDGRQLLRLLSDEHDYVDETPTLVDVWGTKAGEDFRLHLYKA